MKKDKFFVWCVVKRHLDTTSIRHTRIRYNYIFRWLKRKKLTKENVEKFILYLREKALRNASINSYIRVINLIDIFERENGKDYNLLKKISYFPKQFKVPTILSIDEIESLLEVDIEYRNYRRDAHLNEFYRNIIYVLASTGCRYSEMSNLKKEYLHLGISDGYIEFKDTKTNDDRNVPIPPILVERLREFTKYKNGKDLVFLSKAGLPIPEQTFMDELQKRVKASGLSNKHIYPHCFRNSFIMEHLRRGTDPLTIAKLVGHRDVNSTLGYTKYNMDDLIRGAENHPLFAKSLTPQKILEKIEKIIEKWTIMSDTRFTRKVVKTNNSFLLEFVIK